MSAAFFVSGSLLGRVGWKAGVYHSIFQFGIVKKSRFADTFRYQLPCFAISVLQ